MDDKEWDSRSMMSATARRLSSASSLGVVEQEQRHYEEITKQGNQNKWKQMGKMLAVMLVPVSTLIIVSLIALVQAIDVQRDTQEASIAIEEYLAIDNVVTRLQIERGKTTSYLSSNGSNKQAFTELEDLRAITDEKIDKVHRWPAESGIVWPTFDDFVKNLTDFRNMVWPVLVNSDDAIYFYSYMNGELMNAAISGLKLPEKGEMWTLIVATSTLLRASEVVGIQRALCAPYFTVCYFTPSNARYLTHLLAQEESMLEMGFAFYPKGTGMYREMHVGTPLEESITSFREQMHSEEYRQECRNFPDGVRFTNTLIWFDNITEYIFRIKTIRDGITSQALQSLDDVIASSQAELVVYMLLMVVVTVATFASSFWYAARLYGMITRLSLFAQRIRAQTHDLAAEMKKTDVMVRQMLPKDVAEKLKRGEPVEAQYFMRVTIFFSDIVGFTNLSASSTAMQVVELLNRLYSLFDGLIDKRDAYKVETIGDAYMVVSGAPHPTQKHASEIALLSLDLVDGIQHFVIPHRPDEKLRMRIGLHSGPCVAGVVGVKMPRYCLFGDTVNIASKMESQGVAGKVHISEKTVQDLARNKAFKISYRGTTDFAGKGPIKTYFLDEYDATKDHRPSFISFRID